MMVQQQWLCPCLIFLLFFSTSSLPFFPCKQYSSQKSEISTPFASSPVSPMTISSNYETVSPAQNLSMPESPPSSSLSTNQKVVKAIVATAAITLVIAGIFFFLYQRHARRQQKEKINTSFRREEAMVTHEDFRKVGRKVKPFILDENRRDAIYVKNFEGRKPKATFSKVMFNPSYEEEEKTLDVPVERWRKCEHQEVLLLEPSCAIGDEEMRLSETVLRSLQPLEIAPPVQSPALPASPTKKNLALPPPPPPPPPPSPPIPQPPPPPPPIIAKKISTPPPPPRPGGLVPSLKPPPVPKGKTNNKSGALASTEDCIKGTSVGHTKLKPLHWDKVITNADHSMVWDEINNGSLRFDDELIEMLFGYTTSNHKTPQKNGILPSSSSSNPAQAAQIFILEPRKSQNTAIVLKSLAISRKEILDAVLEGQGLTTDILEKLTRISPTQEEEAKIVQFSGNPTKLADAESFLYYILKASPSAFLRINAMLFRSNYDAEILHLKKSLQTLELGCKELRTRGLFLKLLEAILKAGNRMNAGTSRGNAQGFNLTALRKLSDVKSTDGKTTLLHFVVEQAIRAEGRRCVLNQNQALDRNNSQRGIHSDLNLDSLTVEEQNKEYLLLGLPALGGLSAEFSNVKKAATKEYDSFINTCSSLTARVAEIRSLMAQCNNDEGGGFVREMKGFLEQCEEELKVVREEQTRIMELVKRTTEYYQAGASKIKGADPLQLFVIVKDFLDMVDQVGIDISRRLQKKNVGTSAESSSPPSPTRTPVRFPDFRLHLMSDVSRTASSTPSESDDDF